MPMPEKHDDTIKLLTSVLAVVQSGKTCDGLTLRHDDFRYVMLRHRWVQLM